MLTPWKENYDQPRQHIKKQRHYFANKGLSGQSYGFSSSHVWMWELDHKESWVLKKADAFELWCWRRLLRVPWTASRSNQSILKEISPEYSLEGLMLKLKFQYLANWCEELTHLKRPWCWKRVKEGEGGDRMSWLDGITDSCQWSWIWVNSGSWWWTGRLGVLQSKEFQIWTWLNDWTELMQRVGSAITVPWLASEVQSTVSTFLFLLFSGQSCF